MNHLMIGLNGPLGYIFSISKDYIKKFAYNEKAAFPYPLAPLMKAFCPKLYACLVVHFTLRHGGPFYPYGFSINSPLGLNGPFVFSGKEKHLRAIFPIEIAMIESTKIQKVS